MAVGGFLKDTQFHDREAQRVMMRAGLFGGVLYGLILAATVWGYDTWVLSRCHAELAWGKVLAGMPLMLAIGLAAGAIAAAAHRATASVLVWLAGGCALGLVAGWAPYGGWGLVTWVVEPRLRGLPLYPMGPAELTRMWFLAVVVGCVGAAVGLVMQLLMEKAWDLARPDGRPSAQSWLVMLLCAPLAILPGIACDDIANRDLRSQQQAVHDLIVTLPASDSIAAATLAPYREQISPQFVLHLAEYNLELSSATVDVAFEGGFVARCSVLGQTVASCQPHSLRLSAWMQALLNDVLAGGRPSEIEAYADHLSVPPQVQEWLAAQRGRIRPRYDLSPAAQRDGWVVMQAAFGPGLALECYFSGATPAVLHHCQWQE